MRPQHGHEFLEWLQLGSHCRVHPLEQVLLGAPRLLVGPEQLEGFLQVPGADQRRVPAHQRREPFLLFVVQIPRILQQQPTGSLDADSLLAGELPPQVAAGRIHSLIQMLDDVEPIEQDLRVDGVVAYQLGVRRPHVHANHLKRLAAPFAQFLGKERPHRLLAPVVAHP